MDCGVFTMNRNHLRRAIGKWRRRSCSGYRQLSLAYNDYSGPTPDDTSRNGGVTVVVGKERRVFKVDPHLLQVGLLHSLLHTPTTRRVCWDNQNPPANGSHSPNSADARGCIVFLDCDAILFEHVLWLVCNDDPSLPHLNLEELMDFYDQDGV